MKTKRILSIALTLVMLLGMLPGMNLTAYAANNLTIYIMDMLENMDDNEWGYQLYDGDVSIAEGTYVQINMGTWHTGVMNIYMNGEVVYTKPSGSLYKDDVYHFTAGPNCKILGGYQNMFDWDGNPNVYITQDASVAVTGVTLNPNTAQTIDVGGSVAFTATVEPAGASDKTVKWSVGGTNADAVKLYSDSACTTEVGADATDKLTVYAKGESAGSATVTATSNADSTKSASCDVTVNAAQTQTEELLTTITAVGASNASTATSANVSYSTEDIATLTFSQVTPDGYGRVSYVPTWGWWGYGITLTVTPADGYTITKCVFYDDANRTATDSEAPFVVETAEEGDKAPKVNGTPILAYTSKGIKKIEVYGYATPTATHSVTITPGNNMTKTTGSGDAEQTGLSGAMTPVVYTANEGYYFPENYSVEAVNEISVTRNSYTQITVSGTPTADAAIALTAPTAKTTPDAPTTAAATDCTTADNNDGTLTGVTTAMEYKKSDADSWTAGTGNDITGLVPGTYYVRLKATDTANASGNQELTIADYLSVTKTAAKADLDTLLGEKTEADYDADDWTTLTQAIADGKTAIDNATTTEAVNTAKNNAVDAVNAVKTKAQKLADAKTTAKNDLDTLQSGKNQNDYDEADWTTLTQAIADGKTAIDNATTTEAVNTAKNNAVDAVNAVKTKAQKLADAKTTAKNDLDTLQSGKNQNDYDEADWTTLTQAITDGKTAIDNATTTEAITTAKNNAVDAVNAVKTKAQKELDNAKTSAVNTVNAVNANDYIAADQQTVTDAKTTALAAIEAATTEEEVTTALNNFNNAIASCTTQVVADQIAQVMSEVSAKTGSDMTYTGSPIQLINTPTTALPAGYTMKYAVTTENVKPTDESLYTTSIPAKTDAGTYYVWYKVKGDKDHLDSEPVCVEAAIAKRNVTLTSAEDSKDYDGKPLTNNNITVTGDGWAEGEGATYNVTGTQTLPGASDNGFTYTLNNNTKESNYNISKVINKLTVNDRTEKYEINVEVNSDNVTYDGNEHEVSGFKTLEFLCDDVTYTVSGLSASVIGTDAGTYDVVVTGTPLVKNSDDKDLTKQFIVNIVPGQLVIDTRNVSFTSASETKQYDGEPLTNDNVEITGDGFAEGEGASFDVTGNQLVVGSSANTFTYTLNEGTNPDNYSITSQEGTLTVTNRLAKYEIIPKANSGEFTYDGSEHSVTGFVTDTFEVATDDETTHIYTLSGLTAEGIGTDVGEYTVNITGTPVVIDAEGNDVSSEFSVTPVAGNIVINKRNVTLTSASDSKAYDGKELTNAEVTVSGDGWAEGEGAEYKVTGTRKLPGETRNSFTYTLNEGTNADNYEITSVEGILTITDRKAEDEEGSDKDVRYEITVVANSGNFTYDGTEHEVSGIESTEFIINDVTYTVSGLEASAKGTEVGTYPVKISGTPVVTDADGNDLTKQFTVYTKGGSLTVVEKTVNPEGDIRYSNYSGDRAVWTKGSNAGCEFVFKRSVDDELTFGHFTGIDVESKAVDASNYTAVSGSVVITLKPEYLETLAVGDHLLTANFDDGNSVTVKFTIKEKSEEKKSDTTLNNKKADVTPETGDTVNVQLIFLVMVLSMCVIFVLCNLRSKLDEKKRRR